MKIKDLKKEEVVVGLRIWNINKTNKGTIVSVVPDDDDCRWVEWDGLPWNEHSCFYGNACECEIVEEDVYISSNPKRRITKELTSIVEEGYEISHNQLSISYDGNGLYVVVDNRESPKLIKEFKNVAEAVDVWLKGR